MEWFEAVAVDIHRLGKLLVAPATCRGKRRSHLHGFIR